MPAALPLTAPFAAPLVGVDWGTSNRRLNLIDAAGNCLHEEEDHQGVASLGRAALAGAIAQLQERFPKQILILAGMIGSSIGWKEMPYLNCPTHLAQLAAGVVQSAAPPLILIPGVRTTPGTSADVMRGEEVQLIGAVAAGLIPANGIACHPGTHTKWARIKEGALHSFSTVMTGELFALLRAHSILADALKAPVEIGPAFEAGIHAGFAATCLSAALFEIRARLLLGELAQADAASWASGLLIGADIGFGTRLFADNGPIAILGDPDLTKFYATGLRIFGKSYYQVSGSKSFISGIYQIWRQLSCPA